MTATAPHELGRVHVQGERHVEVEGEVASLPPEVVVGSWQPEPGSC